MSNSHGAPPPPGDSFPGQQPGDPHAYPPPNFPTQHLPTQQYGIQDPTQPYPQQPHPQQQPAQPHNNKNLIIILGAVAAVVIVALIAVFVWVIPGFSQPQAQDNPVPLATGSEAASPQATDRASSPEGTATPSENSTGDMPAGSVPLPDGWDQRQGPANVPAADDVQFTRFVTGESSFAYLASWSSDGTFGITKDPVSGTPMQQKAEGTEERDGDGISTAFAFFAEAEEGKFGKEPAEVQAAIKDIEAKLKGIPTAELPQHLVGHKCASDFVSSTPEVREFRRSEAVVVQFTCTNAGGDAIRAVNLFTVTPWGTPQMVGVSGHESYWNANPELLEKMGNSYRANRWKLAG
ncbi:hypothetical protein [Arthrobacter sp.]|uniref:hypothetical protein n=1 Tax=Arthrobacter sp. TaxID=1667 RepID=UPI002811DDDE|nr:hypothetical protein [Arthrobacter sp.]